MKELYTSPVVDVELFEAVDVIRTSGSQQEQDDPTPQTPIIP